MGSAPSGPALPRRFSLSDGQRLGLKFVLVGLLSLISLIALQFVDGLIGERRALSHTVQFDIQSKWSQPQILSGPVMVIPTISHVSVDKDGRQVRHYGEIVFPADRLDISGTLVPETRHRGIYDVTVYTADLQLKADFANMQKLATTTSAVEIFWKSAYIAFSVSDFKGIEAVAISWDGSKVESVEPANAPTPYNNSPWRKFLRAPISTFSPNNDDHRIEIDLRLLGSASLKFTPLAQKTRVNLSSQWPHPSFIGNFIPKTHTIEESGFSAEWEIFGLAAGVPKTWSALRAAVFPSQNSSSGVNLYEPVGLYQKVERATKYGFLFIGLTFLFFYGFEAVSRIRIHFVPYLLVGFALSIFFLLLLSLSEQIDFGLAYGLASLAVTVLTTAYAFSLLKQWRGTFIFAGVLSLLYATLYFILRSEDFALLSGTALVFTALAAMMYATRNVNWYAPKQDEEPAANAD